MILAELELENYKQYVDPLRIPFPEQGLVAVIGSNGAGKTTLFEAIEWVLYKPGRIANNDVPPRRGTGATRVQLTLLDPRDGERYVIERTLKRGLAKAEVWKEGREGSPIVQGSDAVTHYVRRDLIGLSHSAFVSTFFTRQKELTFFGAMRATERRRMVSRLLNLEAVRDAQAIIADQRGPIRAEAQALQRQHDEQSAERDFAAELGAAERAIAEQAAAFAAALAAVEAAGRELAAAETVVGERRALQERDNALSLEEARIGGERKAAEARREAAVADLVRLAGYRAELTALRPVAARREERRRLVAALDAERERAARLEQFDRDIARCADTRQRAAGRLAGLVRQTAAPAGVEGWTWTRADEADPEGGAERLLALLEGIDAGRAESRAADLRDCRIKAEFRDKQLDQRRRYLAKRDRYLHEREELLRGGEPGAAIERARSEREAAQQAATEALTRAENTASQRVTLGDLAGRLGARHFDDRCPTCARPFTPEEVEATLGALERQIAALRRDEAAERKAAAEAARRATRADEVEKVELGRLDALRRIEAAIEASVAPIEEIERVAKEAVEACAAALRQAGIEREPEAPEVEAAQREATRLRVLVNTTPVIRQLRDQIRDAARSEAEAAAARREFGDVRYDQAAHEAARGALAESEQAAGQIERLERELAREPAVARARTVAAAGVDRLDAELSRLGKERAAVGFDPAALEAAVAARRMASERERAATQALVRAQQGRDNAEAARDRIVAERERLGALLAEASARAQEAADLDRMYDEFNRFDRYVAVRVTPRLEAETGALLAAATDGRYSRVTFDQDYGLRIFDGEESFPVEHFSGGERDVAALCARLALSRMIGSQAKHPPSFLVLDEVFGSLDQERRAQVLEILGSLSELTDAFRQLFIISHVEDVQFSPVMNEVWRVTNEDGVSRWENLTQSRMLAEV